MAGPEDAVMLGTEVIPPQVGRHAVIMPTARGRRHPDLAAVIADQLKGRSLFVSVGADACTTYAQVRPGIGRCRVRRAQAVCRVVDSGAPGYGG
jgi:hypothetical protein